ncbi:gamma-glutamyltransferase family protein [Sphingomonas sp.]|uniref:gamma-glutamyltransferase family protein n=1 Tax=Sphingomonas sp. TaxID=28214 RepID=UPI003B3B8AE0
MRKSILGFIGAVASALTLAAAPAAAQEQGPKPAAHAKKAMVSSNHPLVTKAMLEVLRKGGNALDAAMVGMVLQTVVEPQMTTLGGAMGFLYYDARSQKYYYLDGELNHTKASALVSPGWNHLSSGRGGVSETSGRLVAVPGMVAGMKAAVDRFGTLKWADYFQPAIAAADKGFPMYSFLYGEMADVALGRLSVYPASRAEFLPGGYVPPVGTTITRPNLSRTMRRLAAEGPSYFYTGEWAQHFVDAVRSAGGAMTMEDLSSYKAEWREPVRSTFRGYELIASPPPATGGTLIEMILNIVEPWDLKAWPHYSQSADTFQRIRRAFAFAENLTDDYFEDPRAFAVPTDVLLSKDLARSLTALIDGSMPVPAGAAAAAPVDPAREQFAANLADMKRDPHSTDTDQIVVVDAQGNMISLTHSVNGPTFGIGLVVDGVVTNAGNVYPGKVIGNGIRTVTPFPPTMVAKDGKPVLTIGSPGLASRAVALTLINYLGYGMSLEAATDAPRFQGAQPSVPATIESRVTDQTRAELTSRYGVSVRTTTPYNWHFGSIHAIAREADGSLTGVADPRRSGLAAGY